MLKENLIPKKPRKFPRSWMTSTLAFTVSDLPSGAGGDKPDEHAATIEGLEQRRRSIPLAQLGNEEVEFFDIVEQGNLSAIEKFVNDHRTLNINCINYTGLNALHIAIKKEYLPIVRFLFQKPGLDIKDAALQAVATGNVEMTEIILDSINKMGQEKEAYTESPDYSPDITPLILAAQRGDYKMVRMLLERGDTIEKPHLPTCLCARCKEIMREAGAAFSQIRLNAYKAISNPAYIVQVTNDPILYAFELDQALGECGIIDKEFRTEYIELAQTVRDFTVEFISHCRNTTDIEFLLKVPWGYTSGYHEEIVFPRLQVALDNKQKEFVAHSMVQQLLTSYWLGEFTKWSRLRLYQKCLHVLIRVILLPFICIGVAVAPKVNFIKKFQAPINRYLLSLASYLLFLLLVFLLNYYDTGVFRKGSPKTGLEGIIICYVLGFIAVTFSQLFSQGWKRFFSVPWHWYDIAMETLYIVIFILWIVSDVNVKSEHANKKKSHERKFWHKYDATLLHEGLFAIATVLSFGKLAYYCLQSSRMGPLQVSLGKMITQIAYFLVFCFLIITSFSVPMARSYSYYTGMTQTKQDGSTRSQLPAFSSFSHSFSTFFWAMFGMSPVESTDVIVENLVKDKTNPVINTHDFTETVGIILYSTYHLIMVIALINTLIAILSNTFQRVVDNADVEFKFARTKLWMPFFDPSAMYPSPFNLALGPVNTIKKYCSVIGGKVPGAKISFSFTRCCYIQYEKEEFDTAKYETLAANLVQRYFRTKMEE